MFLDGIKSPKNRLVEMFHALTPASVKEHIIKEMTSSDSCFRILVCTMAFGMGVDCKDLNCSIHLGPSKNIEMYLQESGRIGRDGKPSTSLVFYNSLLLATSDNTIRGYCNSTTCRRNYLSSIFPKSGEKSAVKGCTCCDKCTGECDCASVNCQKWLDFEEVKDTIPAAVVRKVTSSQRKEVNNKLWLYGEMLLQKYNDLKPVAFPNLFIEFGSNQVQQVIENLEEIFSIEDVYKNVEIWRKEHANNIISIIEGEFHDTCIDAHALNLTIEEDTGYEDENLAEFWADVRDHTELADLLMDSSVGRLDMDSTVLSSEEGNDSQLLQDSKELTGDVDSYHS